MLIRPYESSDYDACIVAFESNMPKYFLPQELPDFTNWLDKYQNGGPYHVEGEAAYFVIEEDGLLIACGGVFIEPQNNLAGMVWGMVDNRLHKRGIGKKFLLFRIEYIRNHCPSCRIKLDTTQHSYPFFEKYGFSIVKYTENGYAEGMHRYDMLLVP